MLPVIRSTVGRVSICKTSLISTSSRSISRISKLFARLNESQGPHESMSLSDSYTIMRQAILDTTDFPNASDTTIRESIDRLARALDYNVPHGKQFRGKAVVSTVKILKPNSGDELLLQSHAVGWSVELAQAAFLVADDIMDGSQTRRGNLCWYKLPEVGVDACNDIIILQNAVYFLLNKFVGIHPNYSHISSLMMELIRKTTIGQILDTETSKVKEGQKGMNLDMYTMQRYRNIVLYKTAFYTVSHPIRFGLYLAGVTDPVLHKEAEEILLKMGEFFQIQDDFLDVFGDPSVTGKIGTDIEDGKCNWPVVRALEKANEQQRSLLQENYGVKDPNAVKAVRKVFSELSIEEDYREYEKKQNDLLKENIANFCEKRKNSPEWGSTGFPPQVFTSFLDKLFGRKA